MEAKLQISIRNKFQLSIINNTYSVLHETMNNKFRLAYNVLEKMRVRRYFENGSGPIN